MSVQRRRTFLAASGSLGLGGLLSTLPRVTAAETVVGDRIARFSAELEPLVQFLESTPRDAIIEQTARRVQAGLSYRELLAALMLAGVRNVNSRPIVGFKFHAVMVVHSAHLASISGPVEDRWLPLFWAVDNFKSSQARDVREGDWTMSAVDEAALPPPHQANRRLREALDAWDEAGADVAVTAMVRHFGAHRVFDELAAYAARDFRHIGHKVIFLSNAQRTLHTIGWEYSEPIMRSVVYAMLNHHGEPNPATSDLAADRPGRHNRPLAKELPDRWRIGTVDAQATADLVRTLHDCSPVEASQQVAELIGSGVSVQSIWDGIYGSAAELMVRRPGIVALHSVTTTNAIRYAFQHCGDDLTRKYLLLQNASFLPLFRVAAAERGTLRDRRIDQWQDNPAGTDVTIPDIFTTLGNDRDTAAEQMYQYLAAGGDPRSMVDHARRLVFLKGNDSHDYKFSSAALEDYRLLSTIWRNRFLAASTYQLRSQTDSTRPLVNRIREAIG